MRQAAVMIVLALAAALSGRAQTAIGHWRDCLDYTRCNRVEVAEGAVYGAAKGGVVRFDTRSRTLTTMSKATGLSDVGVATLAYDSTTACLTIAYTNGNLDIVDRRGAVHNLSDIKRTELSPNKEINAIRYADGLAYVGTGFGVVVVDMHRYEIKETWFLGAGGSHTAIYDLAIGIDSIYAATAEGLKSIDRTNAYPSVSERWHTRTLPGDATAALTAWHGEALVVAAYTADPLQCTLYRLAGGQADSITSGQISALHTSAGMLTATIEGEVLAYDAAMNTIGHYRSTAIGELHAADAAFTADGTLWVAHPWAGLAELRADGGEDYHVPSSPVNADNCYRLRPFRGSMMLCAGGHNTTYGNNYLAANLYTERGGQWSQIDRSNGALNGATDAVDAIVNPRDTTETLVALWGTGIASVHADTVQTIYNSTNTGGALRNYSVGAYTTLRTGAIDFDRSGNLWVAVSHTTHALAKRSATGEWTSFSTEALSSMLFVDKLLCDSVRGYIWMAGSDNALYVHDGVSRLARVNPNNGSKMQTETINALAQDQSGNIWIGTNKGIKVIYDGYNAFRNGGHGETSPVTCNNITISNGLFSEYLMAYENITCIAVDGANRKWVGTAAGGLYLLSANGMEQLAHYTTADSPLLADKIVCLGIQPRSGEVYVGTDRGLQVVRGTATYAEAAPQPQVYAFPNPVRPDYDGPIAIKGLTRNGLVHITDATGNSVYATTAEGGQAIWNGCTQNGERVASGVYYVFASDEEGSNRSVAKILIIR